MQLEQAKLEFFASCLSGLEKVLADELKTLGIDNVRPLSGGVAFFCQKEGAYRACLWSRLASRIMLVVGRVNAENAHTLYEGVFGLRWEEVLASGVTIAVRAHGTNENLRNTRFTSLKVKDAIVDYLRERRGVRASNHMLVPRASIDVRLRDNRAVISLDFSGEALNHRNYFCDDDAKDAALHCSRAAGLLALAGWTTEIAADCAFLDPISSDGILLTEAASIACNRASGLGREKWGFRSWSGHNEELWESLYAEAEYRFKLGCSKVTGLKTDEAELSSPPNLHHVCFFAVSDSVSAITRARNHIRRAGLRQAVSVEQHFPKESRISHFKKVLVASTLDAPVRVDTPVDTLSKEAAFVQACAQVPNESWFAAIGGIDLAIRFGCNPTVHQIMGKGRVETTAEVFNSRPIGCSSVTITDYTSGALRTVSVLEPTSDQFSARLRKVCKERRKWAAREGVSCYRLYDSDLPDYAVAIDWYTGAGNAVGNNYLHISEYAPPASIDPDKARRRFSDVVALAPVICGVRSNHVFLKCRMREKGGGQYFYNAGSQVYVTTIEEAGYLFEVDLAARLDTGIFLDHRLTRGLVRDSAKGARFLNLFAYTGTASVYAAGGGAVETTTVDISQTYLNWAQRNMKANGFTGSAHSFERADVLKWITNARRARKRYDLIFVDPPTFSNSKAMGKKTWQVQRDHVELLIGVAHLLSEGGQAIFSCNLRTFKPDVEKLEKYKIVLEDISLNTIPLDFIRTPKIHKCYFVRRRRE